MALITGPRQVGKTTLVKHILEGKKAGDAYFNWDIESHRKSILRSPEDFWREKIVENAHPCIALDEIHKYPRWKKFLKGLFDAVGDKTQIMITGSGRLNTYQRGGDSLFGRYHLFHLHPLSVGEITRQEKDKIFSPQETVDSLMREPGLPNSKATLEKLFTLNGFPEPFYKNDPNTLHRWRREHRQLIIREDLRDLTRIREIGLIDALVELLPERVGSTLSLNALREDLEVSFNTVKNWIQTLSSLYYLFSIRPFQGRLARTLKQEAKVYLFDGSVIQKEGPRFENMVALHLLKACDTWNDLGYGDFELHYVRDKEKREVDFLIANGKKPWALIECKYSDKTIDRSLLYFQERLKPTYAFQAVYALEENVHYKTSSGIFLTSATHFLSKLP
ncbi:MAG: ATP-binding protein [Chlamydiae bacterium]|nr:ATP-binding protein [Chlamydiota bacterium]MBI3278202.1 ATP-binding protein [Chlamydiota bacterium]